MTDTLWRQRPGGFAANPTGLYTTPRDMAKLGQLVLDKGKAADGKRVISAGAARGPVWSAAPPQSGLR